MSKKKNENFDFVLRASLGTNLYSDWDQFKSYAWLGLGIELGFGNGKSKDSSKVK